eukprot:6961306-Heterocapsa_arctica.AAC.1
MPSRCLAGRRSARPSFPERAALPFSPTWRARQVMLVSMRCFWASRALCRRLTSGDAPTTTSTLTDTLADTLTVYAFE